MDQIPPELIEVLKKRVAAELPLEENITNTPSDSTGLGNNSKKKKYKFPAAVPTPYVYPPTILNMPTDLTRLFSAGDIVKSRLLEVHFEKKCLDLTMLPSESDLERYKEPEIDFGSGYDDEDQRSGPRVDRSDSGRGDRSSGSNSGGQGGHNRGGRPNDAESEGKRDARGFSAGLLDKYHVNTKDIEIMGVTMSKEDLFDPPNNTLNTYVSASGEVVQWTEDEEEADYLQAIEAENDALREKMMNEVYQEVYEPEKVLEWWRGEPYQSTAELEKMRKAAARALR